MSTAAVIEHSVPAIRGHWPIVPQPIFGPLEMSTAYLTAIGSEAGRFDRIVVERRGGIYGPNARIISKVPPGLIVDIYG